MAINGAKTRKCKQFDQLEKTLPDGQKKIDLKKNFDGMLLEIEARLTEISNKVYNSREVQQAKQQLEAGVIQIQKELALKNKEVQIIYDKCIEKDPTSKTCKAELENALKRLKTTAGGVSGAGPRVVDELTKVTNKLTNAVTTVVGTERAAEVVSSVDVGIENTKKVVNGVKGALEELSDSPTAKVTRKRIEAAAEPILKRLKDVVVPPSSTGGTRGSTQWQESKKPSLGNILKEYREKKLNDKFNKLVKGMTE